MTTEVNLEGNSATLGAQLTAVFDHPDNPDAHWSYNPESYGPLGSGSSAAHHLIPTQVAGDYEILFNTIAQNADGDSALGFDINDAKNGVFQQRKMARPRQRLTAITPPTMQVTIRHIATM